MRFPRFHFRTAIALGLSMLCMSSVPVFADGAPPSAPTLTGSVDGSTIDLSWTVPATTTSFTLRRSTTAAPANTSEGVLVTTTADSSVTSYSDTGLSDGTYYYSVFAINGFGNSNPGSVGPLTVSTVSVQTGSRGGAAAHQRIKQRYKEINAGLHESADAHHDTTEPSLNDVGIFVPGTGATLKQRSSSSSSASSADTPSRTTQRLLRLTTGRSSTVSSSSVASSAATQNSPFQQRVCERILRTFGDMSLERVNIRLKKTLGFDCA